MANPDNTPNPIDLTTLEAVEQLIQVNDGDELVVKAMVTGLSQAIRARCGRTILNTVSTVTETKAGSGSATLYLKEGPIRSVTSLTVLGVALSASPDNVGPGYSFSDWSLVLLPGTTFGTTFRLSCPGIFPRIPKAVQVTYTAGYDTTTDPAGDALYNGAPYDLGAAVTAYVAQEYKRRDWVDQANKTIATGETLAFRSWEMPPWIARVLDTYSRNWY